MTYQIAHDDLAISVGSGSLGKSRLRSSATSGLGRLLNASDGSSGSGAAGRASLGRAAAAGAALRRGDLVERLVELARHCDEGFCGCVYARMQDNERLLTTEAEAPGGQEGGLVTATRVEKRRR